MLFDDEFNGEFMIVRTFSLAKLSTLVRPCFLILLFLSSVSQAIELSSIDGSAVNLEHYILDNTQVKNADQLEQATPNNHWLLIKLWSVDCGVCRQQVPVISKMHESSGEGLAPIEGGTDYTISVLGISTDSNERKEEVALYLKDKQPSYPNLISSYHPIAGWLKEIAQEEYRGTPTYLLFDPSGKLAGVQTSILKEDSLHSFIARY